MGQIFEEELGFMPELVPCQPTRQIRLRVIGILRAETLDALQTLDILAQHDERHACCAYLIFLVFSKIQSLNAILLGLFSHKYSRCYSCP